LFVELAAGGFGRFALSEAAVSGKRFFWGNPFFSYPDAAAYASLIERFRPSQIIEVGSGFSSALALDVLERQGVSVQLTFIEPDPARLIELTFPADAPRFRLIRSSVQDIDLSLFRSLGAGDFLLIDSTQVAKTGGDVLYEAFFKSSPR
jgi:cephalosporin hydroxylase